MKKNFFIIYLIYQNVIFLLLFQSTYTQTQKKIDLNLISFIKFSDGLGQIPISFISTLYNKFKINFINSRLQWFWPDDLDPHIIEIINKSKNINEIPNNSISIYTDTLNAYSIEQLKLNCKLKFAYSLVEGTEVPSEWVKKLNEYFDGVLVGDNYLIDIYKNSGVKIPIFVLPIALDLEPLLIKEKKFFRNEVFTLGFSGGFGESKNHKLLIQAFCEEFINEQNLVKLKLHGRQGHYYNEIKNFVNSKNQNNIELIFQTFTRDEYINFLLSLDAYVILSKGEGFSITPRESLALGLPTIVSNNTSQKTICNSGFVYSVKSEIKEPHITVGKKVYGYDFNCKLEDAKKALRDVYNNYTYYLNLSKKGRNWVKQYTFNSLKDKYANLIEPKKILFGNKNVITNNFFMTSSKKLYNKYLELYR